MKQNLTKSNMWNAAGTAGLVLGGVSSIYLFLTQLLSGSLEPATIWQQVAAFALWGIKFFGCIWLMSFFMKKYVRENAGLDNKDTFRMGVASALLSAILYSGIYLANMLYISADYYDMVYQTMLEQMTGHLDSNSLTMLEKVIADMPQITFFCNISYCFIFGTVLSAILSRNIPEKDPFAEYKPDEQ